MLNGFGNSAPNWLHIFQWLMYLFAFPFEGEKETCFPTFLTLIGICLDPGRFCLFVCFSPQQRFNKSNVSLWLSAVLSSASAKGCWTFAYIHTHTPPTMHLFAKFTNNLFAWSQLFCDKSHPSSFKCYLLLVAVKSNCCYAGKMACSSDAYIFFIFNVRNPDPWKKTTPLPIVLLALKPSISASNKYTSLDVEYEGQSSLAWKNDLFFFFLQFVWWFCHWVIETVNYSYTN